jgi:HK97 family phage major capsid protein
MSASKHTPGRYIQSLAHGKGNPALAAAWADGQGHWTDRREIVGALNKSAVGGTVSGDFSGQRSIVADSFLEVLRTYSVPMRLAMRVVPPRTRVYLAGGVVAATVAPGAPIPVLHGSWTDTTLILRKDAGIVVVTDELIKSTDPAAPLSVVDDLAAAVADSENLAFCSPWVSGSIFNGATTYNESGVTASTIAADLQTLIEAVPGVHRGGAWIMHPTTASYIGTRHASGDTPAAFPGIGPQGGTLLGLPVLVTDAMAQVGSPASRAIGLVAPGQVFWASGNVEITLSSQAALEMADDASGNSATGTAGTTSLVSMYQANSVAARAIRESAWYAKSGSTAWLTTSY